MTNQVAFVIKGYDHMFPGRPNFYYYGQGPSQSQPGKTANLFGGDINRAFVVEAGSEWCAEMVANIIAQGVATPSIKTWTVKLRPVKEEKV